MPCKKKDFIRKLKKLGFCDFEAGGRHGIMWYGSYKQVIPNNREYSVPQIKMLLKQVKEKPKHDVSLDEWNKL
ncbi:MAG: type II toxin-antitoxin system HicA family toxin [Candidatus Scalindua sp.]|nr:type II toxin-antitoxin system HicA family toxin [Candidatus Scalindua sp.]